MATNIIGRGRSVSRRAAQALKGRLAARRHGVHHPKHTAQLARHAAQYARLRRHLRSVVKRERQVKMAVVVHVYYPEVWPVIEEQLKALEGHDFDLFIDYPAHSKDFVGQLKQRHAFHKLYAFEVPNWGRDILPFMQLAPILRDKGYHYVLKLHTKKSPHRSDGGDWMKVIVSSLLPSDKRVMKELIGKLEKSGTGIIGPEGEYLSLQVNFEANGVHMTRIMNRAYSRDVSYRVLQAERATHGFFAGSMFWARLDALSPLFERSGVLKYEVEKGQIDATRAHAIERVISLVQSVEGRKLYAVSADGIRPVAYDSGMVPDWSGVYIGPKPDEA